MDKGQNKDRQARYSKRSFLIAFLCVMGIFAIVRHSFSINIPLHVEEGMKEEEKEVFAYTEVDVEVEENDGTSSKKYQQPDVSANDTVENIAMEEVVEEEFISDNLQTESIDTNKANQPHRIRGVWSYTDCFSDIQDIQILAAQQHGIVPVENRKEAEILVRNHKLVNICHSPYYVVDDLTHSIPYLVPRAQHLLNTICLNFIDSCQVKGLPPHLLMVTSVLRTTDDVSNLQKGNKNATTNSCHCYGTTVDIAYNRFMPVTGKYKGDRDLLRWDEPMKKVLAEVLYDLRMQEKCYVKYEIKQGCFHLTCR